MCSSPDNPFYSATRRLARAKKHAADLEVTGTSFINSEPYVRAVDLDFNGVTKLHKVKLIKPFPEELADIATDAFDNLRSVLDQTAYGAAIAGGNPAPNFAYFPFSSTAEKWENRANGLCKDVPSDVVAVFRRFEPYECGNKALWGLNELRNVNQHALLAPLGTASVEIAGARLVMKAPADGAIACNLPMWTPATWDSCKNEMVIFREDPGGHLDYDFKLAPFIAFGDVAVFASEPVLGVFNHLDGY
jgi:hypothetical protein